MNIVAWVDLFVLVMPVLYAGIVVLYAVAFFFNSPAAEKPRLPILAAIVLVHLAYLGTRMAAFDHPPITNVFEIMTMLAASIAIGEFYIEWRTKASSTGFFILLLALVFQTVSSVFIKDSASIPDYLHSRVLGFHVSAALLGYTGISLSAAYGFLYLLLYHEIKSSRFGLIYTRLPNLEMLEIMSHKAEVFGFSLLSVAITIGLLWLPRVFTKFSYLDPKLIGTLVIWAIYGIGLLARRRMGLQGRKMMILSLVAFGFVFLSMTVINLYLSGFHSFY